MQKMIAAEKGETDDFVPDAQPPFYHDIDYVVRTWLEHKLHHTYPDMGGYNDQCEWLMRDWHTLNMYSIRIENGVTSAPPTPDNAPDWQGLMGD